MIKTNFHPSTQQFAIEWPGRVARHDLVYKSPPTDPVQYGMPIGNGDIGALLWCDDRRIYIVVNKCDLWDDSSFEAFTLDYDEEKTTTLRHACRIVIDFGIPIFDTFYLKDFDGRLRLKDGCIAFSLDCPFGKMSLELFTAYNKNVLCARVKTDFAEDDGVSITLERYGSRNYSRWYVLVNRDPSIGLDGTDATVSENALLLSQQLSTGNFVCALKPEGADFTCKRRTGHMAAARAVSCPKTFTFYTAVTSPFDEHFDADYALSLIKEASSIGFDALLAENETCWKSFWERSFIETDDDYLDNLWHLAMYYANAGQRGRYPGRFINSLWNWNRDVHLWAGYFHWNQQELYWGLNAAGHHDLCMPYLNFRYNTMGPAAQYSKEMFGTKGGLFISDIVERRGYGKISTLECNNHTPVGEIALDFWRQYLYTGDLDFLKEKALPYMLGASRFFTALFVKEADGKYHAKGGTAYEGWDVLYDVITELIMARVLYQHTLEALRLTGTTVPDEDKFRDILENLADFTLLDADPQILQKNEDGTYTILRGMFKGQTVTSNKVYSVGRVDQINKEMAPRFHSMIGQYIPQYFPSEETDSSTTPSEGIEIVRRMLNEHFIPSDKKGELTSELGAHPQANIAMIFPMGLIGLKDKGSKLFEAAVTTAMTSRDGQAMGWDPMPIALTRLGLTEAVDAYIYDYPSYWQYYNNGTTHYGPSGVMIADMISPFRRDLYHNTHKFEETFWGETFPFRHIGFEAMGVFSAVMNERLMQSHDGIIRIVPAYGKRDARFKLHAIGGFEVMSQIKDGIPELVAIRSLLGNTLVLENPWKECYCNGIKYDTEIISIPTTKDTTYLFTQSPSEELIFEEEKPAPNQEAKVRPDRFAKLGMERSF